jgi:hypothetical protein
MNPKMLAEIIDNISIAMPHMRVEEGLLYIIIAPISTINPITMKYAPIIAPTPSKNPMSDDNAAKETAITIPPRRPKIPPIRLNANAAVGFSPK